MAILWRHLLMDCGSLLVAQGPAFWTLEIERAQLDLIKLSRLLNMFWRSLVTVYLR